MGKDNDSLERQYVPFFLAILATAIGSFGTYDYFTLASFVLVVLLYIVRKYDFRILIGLGLVVLALGMVERAIEQESNAVKAGTLAYYFLAAGSLGELVTYTVRSGAPNEIVRIIGRLFGQRGSTP